MSPVWDGTLISIQASFGIQVCWEFWGICQTYVTPAVFLLLQCLTKLHASTRWCWDPGESILTSLKSEGGSTVEVRLLSSEVECSTRSCWQKKEETDEQKVCTRPRRSHAWKESLQETQIMSCPDLNVRMYMQTFTGFSPKRCMKDAVSYSIRQREAEGRREVCFLEKKSLIKETRCFIFSRVPV